MLHLVAQFEWTEPAQLAWLIALLPLLYLGLRSRSHLPPARRYASWSCRLLALVLVLAALTGIGLRRASQRRWVVLAVDASRSVQGAGSESAARFVEAAYAGRGEHRVGVLPFAARPGPLRFDGQFDPRDVDPVGSDPAAALRVAAASSPAEYVPQVVLLTDGLATRGDLAEAARGLDLPIDVVPLPAFGQSEVELVELRAGPVDRLARRAPLEIVVAANHTAPARWELERDGQLVAEGQLELAVGEQRIRTTADLGPGDSSLFTARIHADTDTFPENNRGRVRVFAPPRRRVLVVEPQPERVEFWQETLSAGSDPSIDLAVQTPERFFAESAAWEEYDLLLLSNLPSETWPAGAGQAMERYVEQGGGLIVVGGEATFGANVYRDSPLEPLLPVSAADEAETLPPVIALLLVIDRSGSMVRERRMELAREGAKQAIELLQPHDKAGVLAFSDTPLWIAEIEPVDDKQHLFAQIDTIEAAGQTFMYEAIERAFLALAQTVADRRYMILLTDGLFASPGDYFEIAQRMAQHQVRLSTVSISPGAEQELLKEMTRIAGGRHYHSDDATDLPEILVRETRTATEDDEPPRFPPFVYRQLPGLEAESAPAMSGYALTNPKPQAEQLLMAAGRDPLLAWWRYGAGRTVAWTADLHGRGMQSWQEWPGAGRFWQRLIHHAARRPPEPDVHITVHTHDDYAQVRLEIDWEHVFLAGQPSDPEMEPQPLTVSFRSPAGGPAEQAAQPIAPGVYQLQVPAAEIGEYRIQVQLDPRNEPVRHTWFVDNPCELQLRATDEAGLQALAESTGGRYHPEPDQLFQADGRTAPSTAPLSRTLLMIALLLVIADIACRRLPLGHRQWPDEGPAPRAPFSPRAANPNG